MSLEDLRRQYTMGGLSESSLPTEPDSLFGDWMQTALKNAPAEWIEPYAMTLATADPSGDVSARIVLLRGHDADGFVFFTNYESEKGIQLAANPKASLVFYWGYLERQVRVTGTVEKVSRQQSEAYFHKRPRGSQMGAVVSQQSKPLANRESLEASIQQLAIKLGDGEVPLPDAWGGYRLCHERIEFWQGRQNRLHDRIVYARTASNTWNVNRLSP